MPNSSATQVKPAGYETTFITKSELTDDILKTLQERLNSVVSQFQGEVVLTEDWGRKKLAYPISKETRGHYTYFVYTGRGEVVHEIERNLRLQDYVLRFLTVNLEKEFDPEIFREQRAKAQAAAKRREEEREARREERMAERYGHGGHDDRGERGHHRRDMESDGSSQESGE